MKKIIATTIACLLLQGTAFADNIVSNMEVISDASQWGTNRVGEWSFWGVKEFYNVSTAVTSLEGQTLTYVNVDDIADYTTEDKINAAGDLTASGVIDNLNWGMTADQYKGAGIIMAARGEYANTDRIYNADIIIYPDDAKGMTHFRAGNNFGNHKDVAVMFTVPETGNYNIYLDAENRGMPQADGSRTYGGSNFGRISIISAGESCETAENSTEFVIPAANADGIVEYDEIAELTVGTRIFVRLHNGMDMWNDDLFAKLIITKLDENGNAIKIYDLNKIGYSSVENIQFMLAETEETDSSNYIRLFAAKPENVTFGPAFLDGYVAEVSGKWTTSGVNMNGLPGAGWNKADGKIQINSGNKDFILEWTVPESGKYIVNTEAAYTTSTMQRNTIKISCLKKEETEDTDIKATVSLMPGSTSTRKAGFIEELDAGDKILYRVVKGNSNYSVYITPNVQKIDSEFGVNFDLSDEVKNHLGETVTTDMTVWNLTGETKSIQVFACQYDKNGKLLSVTPATPVSCDAWSPITISDFEFVLSENAGDGTVEFYAWSDFETADVMTECIIINLR